MEKEMKSNYSTPIAIVLAGIIIAGAMYFSDGKKSDDTNTPKVPVEQVSSLDKVRAVNALDHIRGNPNAPVIIVEYSDTECPFCSRFHNNMKQIMDEYGKAGKVAWVYRHNPIDQLHSKARAEAVALECANELGGNDKFWEYTDRIYEITPANNGLNLAELPKIAEYVGLDVTKFNTCLTSGKYDAKIQADLDNAQATGGNGTPWSVIILRDQLSGEGKTQIDKYVVDNDIFDNSGKPMIYVSAEKNEIAMNGAMPVKIIKDVLTIILN
jgi:protein-disulfide isomerase